MKYKVVINKAGYILKRVNNKYEYEHRWVWEQHNGKIPPNYIIHHKDRNKQNNDISNLELMSKKRHDTITLNENIKNNVRKSFKMPNQKDFDKNVLLKLLNEGSSIRSIARKFNVSHQCIIRNMKDHGISKPLQEKIIKPISKRQLQVNIVASITKDTLLKLLKENISQRKIANILNVSHTTIQRKVKEYGL